MKKIRSKKDEDIYIEASLKAHYERMEYYMEKCNMSKGAASAAAMKDIKMGELDNEITEYFNTIKSRRSGKK